MRVVMSILLFLCLSLAQAHDIYRWVTPGGGVHYSDVPYPGAERVILPPWPQPLPMPYLTFPSPGATSQPGFYVYKQLYIVKPRPWETIRGTEGLVDVVFALEPALNTNEGHEIQIFVDGEVLEAMSTFHDLYDAASHQFSGR